MALTEAQILIRLLAAAVVGFLFGLERKRRLKPVGRRTHMLICLSCTIVTMISAYGFTGLPTGGVPGDPARLMVGILTGLGFIGGGIIWKSETGGVQGITTAAELLLLAAVGMALGLGLYFLAGAATVIGLVTLEGTTIGQKLRNKLNPAEEEHAEQHQEG